MASGVSRPRRTVSCRCRRFLATLGQTGRRGRFPTCGRSAAPSTRSSSHQAPEAPDLWRRVRGIWLRRHLGRRQLQGAHLDGIEATHRARFRAAAMRLYSTTHCRAAPSSPVDAGHIFQRRLGSAPRSYKNRSFRETSANPEAMKMMATSEQYSERCRGQLVRCHER